MIFETIIHAKLKVLNCVDLLNASFKCKKKRNCALKNIRLTSSLSLADEINGSVLFRFCCIALHCTHGINFLCYASRNAFHLMRITILRRKDEPVQTKIEEKHEAY